ncbi:MAG: GNAT family N-acetyltransferase [Candidatus Eisenbacteria bacterium]
MALDGSRASGRLEGLFLSDKLYFIRELRCAEGLLCSVVDDALTRFLGDSFSSDGIGILSWDRPGSSEVNDALERAGWALAQVDGETVGVVLPQEFPDHDGEGTLFYVAVLPAFRGRGHGRALHAAGLAMLAERGVTRYVGSTDTRNGPMLKIFEANGCSQTGTQLFYRAPARHSA